MAIKNILKALRKTPLAPVVSYSHAAVELTRGTVTGLKAYKRDGRIDHRSWERLLDAHCATNGRSTALLNFISRRKHPARPQKPVSGLLGDFSVAQQNAVVSALHKDGLYVFPDLLPAEFCDRVQRFAEKADTVIETNRDLHAPLIPFDPAHPVSRTYKIPERLSIANEALQELVADQAFAAIAEAYLGSAPMIGGIDVWWSARYGNGPGAIAAQMFHFDFDAPPAWLKLFVHITDVGPENGPHVYVKGTHRPGTKGMGELLARGYERIDDDEVAARFGDRMVRVTGKRGTVFLADTRGLHKGTAVEAESRLIAQLIYCPPVFADHGIAAALPAQLTPPLAAAVTGNPGLYARFLYPA